MSNTKSADKCAHRLWIVRRFRISQYLRVGCAVTAICAAVITMRSLNMDSALIAADGLTDASYWVVGDAYFLGKPRRTAVGMTYIFWKGKL